MSNLFSFCPRFARCNTFPHPPVTPPGISAKSIRVSRHKWSFLSWTPKAFCWAPKGLILDPWRYFSGPPKICSWASKGLETIFQRLLKGFQRQDPLTAFKGLLNGFWRQRPLVDQLFLKALSMTLQDLQRPSNSFFTGFQKAFQRPSYAFCLWVRFKDF